MIPQEPQAALRDSRIAAARFSLSFSEFIIIHLLMMISITYLEQLINRKLAKLPPCAGQAELGQRKLRILDLDDEDEGGDDGDEHDDDGGAGQTCVNANSDPSTLGISIRVMKRMMMVVMTMMVMMMVMRRIEILPEL